MKKSEELKKKIEIIKNIINYVKTEKNITDLDSIETYFWDNHNNLMKTYPFLISQLASSDDHETLDFMIKKLEDIENGVVTKDQADEMVGQNIVDKYVKPDT